MTKIVLAAKCAPDAKTFDVIEAAGIGAVELYLSEKIINSPAAVIALCREYDFRYALHAPNDCHNPEVVARIADGLSASVVVMHDIFWEDEWRQTAKIFKNRRTIICIENIKCVHDPDRFERRLGFSRCTDLEHLQMECSGVYTAAFGEMLAISSHIHLTGYFHGSEEWHTPIHYSPVHSRKMLDMIAASGYSGLVVSEASVKYQTAAEFKKLALFFEDWQREKAK
jgi:hypothetical protein